MTTILLAMDETDASVQAVQAAKGLFGPDTTYLALNVANSPTATSGLIWGGVYAYPYISDGLLDELADASTEALVEAETTAADRAKAAGIDAEAFGEIGDPAHAIVDAAREHAVDAIVVGHHQRNWFQRLFDRSVSDDVVGLSGVPVVVVPEHHD